jgi:hypothetical protein
MIKLKFVFKKLAWYVVGEKPEPEPPELQQNFNTEPEPHKNDAAPQHWF